MRCNVVKLGALLRFGQHLPPTDRTPPLSLGEGDTPLVQATALSQEAGAEVWLKVEGCNPTGSFKGRGMVVAVAKAIESGSGAVSCASTGNTSASAAAYAARAGMEAIVIVPAGKIALGKMAQAIIHGARVISVQGNFDQALDVVRQLVKRHPVTLVNSLNPNRIEGQKTAAYEIDETLERAPDILALPVGNAGNITAYWKGFCQWKASGRIERLPTIWGFQAAGAATTANLGPGFDCLGMDLELHNTVVVQVTRGRMDLRIKGEGARDLRWGEENRVLRGIRLAFEEAQRRPPGLALEQTNEIPLGRGLGSSAAATVGAWWLATPSVAAAYRKSNR